MPGGTKKLPAPDAHPLPSSWEGNGGLGLYSGSGTASSSSNPSSVSHDAFDTSYESGLDVIAVDPEKDLEAALLLPHRDPGAAGVAAASVDDSNKVRTGMLWYATSSLFFSAMGVCTKSLGEKGYTVWQITLVRSVIILCCSLSVLARGDGNWLGHRRWLLFMRGSLGYCSITCYFIACQTLPLADATVFTFLGPLVAALLSPALLREWPSAATCVVIPLNIVGVAMIVQPNFFFGSKSAQLSIVGLTFGLLQPFFSASAKMTVRALRTTEQTNVIILYLMICTFVYSAIGCILTRHSLIFPATLAEWALLLGQGLAGYGNQICITNGLKLAKAAPVMSMQYLSIVVSQVAGMLFFSEFTSVLGNLGMAVIVSSMLLFILWESRK